MRQQVQGTSTVTIVYVQRVSKAQASKVLTGRWQPERADVAW